MDNNIILIGFMGCGKSSLGVRLSYRMRRTLADTDKIIERRKRMAVSEIFDKLGEEACRQMETQCLERLLVRKEPQVIAVGGGLPVREQNQELLKKLGTVIYLRATAETVCERLAYDNTRPLLQGENPEEKVRKLMKEREGIYESVADYMVDTDGRNVDEIADEVLGYFSNLPKLRK